LQNGVFTRIIGYRGHHDRSALLANRRLKGEEELVLNSGGIEWPKGGAKDKSTKTIEISFLPGFSPVFTLIQVKSCLFAPFAKDLRKRERQINRDFVTRLARIAVV